MASTKDRLELCEAILALIERKRLDTGDAALGEAIERVVIDAQFRDLETDIYNDPGAFEPLLVPLRRRQ
jgi:hypothetical protein